MRHKVLLAVIVALSLALLTTPGAFAYLSTWFGSIKVIEVVGTADTYLVIDNTSSTTSLLNIASNPDAPVAPTNFTATVAGNDINLAWTKATGATHTAIYRGETRAPATRDDGELLVMSTGEAYVDLGAASEATTYYYSAWSFSSLGYSDGYANTMGGGAILILLALILLPLGLTIAMFMTRDSMLGFPSAIFWALLGGYAYTQSTTPWGDIYYYLAFASLFGMVTLCAIGAYGLREKRDSLDEGEMDEDGEKADESSVDEELPKISKRTEDLRERAKQRKERGTR